ncbi:MAG: hypothetical protein ABEK59_12305 [Halobacteria archaeon]
MSGNKDHEPWLKEDRRRFLATMGALGTTGIAGCLSEKDGTSNRTNRSTTTTNESNRSKSGEESKNVAPPELSETYEATDGFESGTYENFAPLYVGDSKKFIRPQLSINTDDPIAGKHSLQWKGNDEPQRWAVVSNAFQLNPPIEISAKIRLDDRGDKDYAVGVGIAETQNRAAVVKATQDGLDLVKDSWDGQAVDSDDRQLEISKVYNFSMTLSEETVKASLRDEDGKQLAQLSGKTDLKPTAIALYVETNDDSTVLTFDDVEVTGKFYRVPSDEWTRADPFVVVPRPPDVGEDQGDWVGGQDVFVEDGTYKMWYRIRDNESRGQGYGYAESQDGYNWQKAVDDNPVLVPDYNKQSNEGITVLKVDGKYRAWYTIEKDGDWKIVYATSEDGINWKDHGIVLKDNDKDPMAVYVDGTYYLYVNYLTPQTRVFRIYTSTDGKDWNLQNTIDLKGRRSHTSAYYVEDSEKFWLYAFAEEGIELDRRARVRRASSNDGIKFGELEETWRDPPVGLDHRGPAGIENNSSDTDDGTVRDSALDAGGIDYGSFATDPLGHLPDSRSLPMYYQARHNYMNNRPSWKYAGDGKITLAGKFKGIFEEIPTRVDGSSYTYRDFPLEAKPIKDLDIEASAPATVTVDNWTPERDIAALGSIRTDEKTTLTITASNLEPENGYKFSIDDKSTEVTTDSDGGATFKIAVPKNTSTGIELAQKEPK